MKRPERIWLPIIFVGLPAILFGYVKFALWQANKMSPQFRIASQQAYKTLLECDSSISLAQPIYDSCVTKAVPAIDNTRVLAKTFHERHQYAGLAGYLDEIQACRRDWQASDRSREATERSAQLVRIRSDLARSLK